MHFKITIDQPYVPYTKRFGAFIPIPGSSCIAQVFPAKLCIFDESHNVVLEEAIALTDQITDFSTHLDLKKGAIFVYVKSRQQYFRYQIKTKEDGIHIRFDRGSKKRLFIKAVTKRPRFLEELATGVYKSPEWEALIRRADPKEITPLWFMASQWYEREGEMRVEDFAARFDTLFYPREQKESGYKGLPGVFPLSTLRALFCTFSQGHLALLPDLPSYMKCGRARLLLEDKFIVELLWSNGALKKVILTPLCDQEITLSFPGIACRLRGTLGKKGQILRANNVERCLSISCQKGIKLFLDHFSK